MYSPRKKSPDLLPLALAIPSENTRYAVAAEQVEQKQLRRAEKLADDDDSSSPSPSDPLKSKAWKISYNISTPSETKNNTTITTPQDSPTYRFGKAFTITDMESDEATEVSTDVNGDEKEALSTDRNVESPYDSQQTQHVNKDYQTAQVSYDHVEMITDKIDALETSSTTDRNADYETSFA